MNWPSVLQLVGSHLLTILGFILGAFLIARILVERRTAQSTLAWLLAIVLIPYVGVPLYLMFGGRKIRQAAAKKGSLYPAGSHEAPEGTITRMLCSSGAPLPRDGNTSRLLATGEETYAATMALIESAQQSICISTLILAGDEVGGAILESLSRKAEAGVQVRVLIDGLFQFRSSGRAIAGLRRAGGKVSWFMPLLHFPFRGRANLRLHRKIVLVDGQTAIVGGMNLAREYMGPTPLPGRWRDVSAEIRGPAVGDLARVFATDWHFASGETLPPATDPAPPGSTSIQVIGSGPDVASDLIYDAFLSAVFEARRRLWVATPYFVPDEALSRALVLAARRGLDVRILVPQKSNHRTADYAGASHLRDLADAGAQVWCFKPGMMHGKVVLVDDWLGVLGSANLDMRSLFLDYEIALFYRTRPDIDALAGWFESLLPSCAPLSEVGQTRVLIESVARLVGPLA